MTPPPISTGPTGFACVSEVVRLNLANGKQTIGWYGHLSKTWWRENNGKGQQLTVPVVSWEKIK